MQRREIYYRRKPSRTATWIMNILAAALGVGVIMLLLIFNMEITIISILTSLGLGTIILALKAKTWVRNVWWPQFVERQMMAILGDSVTNLHKETGRVAFPAVWSSSLKNAIVEAMHELASRGRELARLREQVANMTAEHEELDQARLLRGLLYEIMDVMNAIYDTPSGDLIRRAADGNPVPNTAILARIRWELGVSVITTAVIVGINPDEILDPWAVMSPAAKQMLCWHRKGEMSRPLPENWIRAIENRIIAEELKRQPPPEPTEPAPA